MAAVSQMPRWDLTPFFPALESPEFDRAVEDVRSRLRDFASLVGKAESSNVDSVAQFEAMAASFNSIRERVQVIEAYLSALVTTDSFDDAAKAKDSLFDTLKTE